MNRNVVAFSKLCRITADGNAFRIGVGINVQCDAGFRWPRAGHHKIAGFSWIDDRESRPLWQPSGFDVAIQEPAIFETRFCEIATPDRRCCGRHPVAKRAAHKLSGEFHVREVSVFKMKVSLRPVLLIEIPICHDQPTDDQRLALAIGMDGTILQNQVRTKKIDFQVT